MEEIKDNVTRKTEADVTRGNTTDIKDLPDNTSEGIQKDITDTTENINAEPAAVIKESVTESVTYGRIEPQPLPKEEPDNSKKAFDDARTYLSIVLGELEDTKAELDKVKAEKNKKKKNGWKVIAGIEGVLLAALILGVGIYSIKENFFKDGKPDVPAVSDRTSDKDIESIHSEEIEYARLKDNLTDAAKLINQTAIAPFTSEVKKVNGREALCFVYGNVEIGYYNDYENSDDEDIVRRVFIDNGERRIEFNEIFSFDGELEQLCPELTSFEEGKETLVFTHMKKGRNIPEYISFVDIHSMIMGNKVDVLAAFSDSFSVTYEEVYSAEAEGYDFRMIVKAGSASYTYSIPETVYNIAAYNDESCLMFDKNFVMEIKPDGISMTADVYIDDDAYVGRITADIVMAGTDAAVSNIKYGAFAYAEYEDRDSDKILGVRKEPFTDFVTISGAHKERLLIELSDIVERNELDWDNVVTDENGYKSYVKDGVTETVMGIDVSKYQGDIDWEKVKNADVGFAIIRLGYRGMNEGTLEFDPYFTRNIEGALAADIPVGIYFFSQAITEEEAVEEADMVLEAIKDYKVTYPVIFDTEVITTYDARANNLTREERTGIAKAFLDRISENGYNAMIYANTKWFITGLDLELINEYDRWYAYYGDNVTFPYSFDIIQYSDTGSVPGIKGNVDLNMCFKKYEE